MRRTIGAVCRSRRRLIRRPTRESQLRLPAFDDLDVSPGPLDPTRLDISIEESPQGLVIDLPQSWVVNASIYGEVKGDLVRLASAGWRDWSAAETVCLGLPRIIRAEKGA